MLGRILLYLGFATIVIGFIQAIMTAQIMDYDPYGNETPIFEWRYFLMTFLQSLISGVTIIALAEIIRLLNSLNSNFQNIQQATSNPQPQPIPESSDDRPADKWSIDEADQEKIYKLYTDKAILEMIPSYKEGYCIVTLQEFNGPLSSFKKVVDINGNEAREVRDPILISQILSFAKGNQ